MGEKKTEIYDDLLKPAAQETGEILALVPRTVKAMLTPLRKWIDEKEYNVAETEKILAEKLEKVEPDKIVTPEAYVAVPAMQAISYSMASEDLRNLYANLLSKAMNIDTKDKVHPALTEIIKQMSPVDANIFKIIYESEATPVIDLYIDSESDGKLNFIYNLSYIKSYSYESIRISLTNLTRLGLIEIAFGQRYIDDKIYDIVRETEAYKTYKKELQDMKLGKVTEARKFINKTSLAQLFYEICCC